MFQVSKYKIYHFRNRVKQKNLPVSGKALSFIAIFHEFFFFAVQFKQPYEVIAFIRCVEMRKVAWSMRIFLKFLSFF